MQIMFNGLSCSLAGQTATLTLTSGRSEAHPGHLNLTGSGIVINLVGNAAEMFQNTSPSGQRYTVIVQRET